MANHKSAKKRIRSSEVKRLRNRYQHKTTRTYLKKLRESTDKVEAEKLLKEVTSMLDKQGDNEHPGTFYQCYKTTNNAYQSKPAINVVNTSHVPVSNSRTDVGRDIHTNEPTKFRGGTYMCRHMNEPTKGQTDKPYITDGAHEIFNIFLPILNLFCIFMQFSTFFISFPQTGQIRQRNDKNSDP